MLDAELIKKLKLNLTDNYSKAMAALDELGQTETPTLDAIREDQPEWRKLTFNPWTDLEAAIQGINESYRETYNTAVTCSDLAEAYLDVICKLKNTQEAQEELEKCA